MHTKQNPFEQKNCSLVIEMFTMTEASVYHPQIARPITAEIDQDSERMLTGVLGSNHAEINANQLAGIASSIIKPSMHSSIDSTISNGWDTPRYLFVMKVRVHTSLGSGTVYHVQGYTTDNYVLSNSNHINPQTMFVVNSCTEVRDTVTLGGNGSNMTHKTVVGNDQVLFNGNFQGALAGNNLKPIRPEDVVTANDSLWDSTDDYSEKPSNCYDVRTTLSSDPILCSRKNSRPATYMEKLLKGYQHSTALSDFNTDEVEMYAKIKGVTEENKIMYNPVLRALSKLVPPGERRSGIQFTMAELSTLDTTLESRIDVITSGNIHAVNTPADSAYWGGTNNETFVAGLLVNSVSALMMELGFNSIYFSVKTVVGPLGVSQAFHILDCKRLGTGDKVTLCEIFKDRLMFEAINGITQNDAIPIGLEVYFNLFTDSTLEISIDSKPMYRFVSPSFSDSMFSSLVTNNHADFAIIADGLDNLLSNSLVGANNLDAYSEEMHGGEQAHFGQQFDSFTPASQHQPTQVQAQVQSHPLANPQHSVIQDV